MKGKQILYRQIKSNQFHDLNCLNIGVNPSKAEMSSAVQKYKTGLNRE
jgi:hypothetical protein